VIDENDFAGFGGGAAVDGKTTMAHQVLDTASAARGGISFAIGQAVTQISLPMPLKKTAPRVLGRANAPFVKLTAMSANLPFRYLR